MKKDFKKTGLQKSKEEDAGTLASRVFLIFLSLDTRRLYFGGAGAPSITGRISPTN